MRKLAVLIFLTAILLKAQDYSENIRFGHIFNVTLPFKMLRTYEFGDAKTLQYKDEAKDLYLIIVDEEKEQFVSKGIVCKDVNDYYDILTKDIGKDKKDYNLISKKEFEHKGHKIIQTEYSFKVEDNNEVAELYFCQDYVETEKYFYKIACWTTLSNKDKYSDKMKEISKTITEN